MTKPSDPAPIANTMSGFSHLVNQPVNPAVAASFHRLNDAIASRDQARIDLVLAEISGLAARETRAEGSAKQPSIQPTNSSSRSPTHAR